MKELEWYRTLGVTSYASQEEIKEAYRRLVKQFHPDSAGTTKNSHRFVQVTEAYKNLTLYNSKGNLLEFPTRQDSRTRSAWKVKTPELDLPALGELLAKGKHAGLRAFAARSLGNSRKKSAYAYLRKGLYDEEDLVVKSTLEALSTLGIRQCSGELGSLFSRGNREIKRAVLETVEKIGPAEGFKSIILAGMRDQDPRIRTSSLNLFSRMAK